MCVKLIDNTSFETLSINLTYLKDSDNHNLGFAVELVKSIKNNDFIKPDKSFETDIQHFAETFKEATELVKAPEAKHM